LHRFKLEKMCLHNLYKLTEVTYLMRRKEREKEHRSKALQVLFAAKNFDMKSCLMISIRVKQYIASRKHLTAEEFEFTLCFARSHI